MIDKSIFLKLFNYYPPYLGAGIKVKRLPDDDWAYNVSMKLRFYNNNYVGVHFGGSLYSMCDPFYMLILMNKLGRSYIVWDKSASIEFKRPGKGRVSATFRIPKQRVEQIKDEVEQKGKSEPEFRVEILNDKGEVISEVTKRLWVKKKV